MKGRIKLKFGLIITVLFLSLFSASQSASAASYSLDIWWANYWDWYGNDFDPEEENAIISIHSRTYTGVFVLEDIIYDLEENGDNGFQASSMPYEWKITYWKGQVPIDSYTWQGATNLVGCETLGPDPSNIYNTLKPYAEVCINQIYDTDTGGGGPPRYFDPLN